MLFCLSRILVLTPFLTYSFTFSLKKIVYHRPDSNHTLAGRGLILLTKDVKSKIDCAVRCQEYSACNLVVYNRETTECKLYSDYLHSQTVDTPESGWQHYGASCDSYRLNTPLSASDAMRDNPDWACASAHHSLIACSTTSCFLQGVWVTFTSVCTKTLFQSPPVFVSTSGHKRHDIQSTFVLQHGHVISLRVTGAPDVDNNVDLCGKSWGRDLELPYRLRLKWYQNKAEFATRPRDKEENLEVFYNLPVSSRVSNYSLDIHIKDTKFKTFVDGRLLMTNRMSLPFSEVNRINLYGFQAVHKFKIGEDSC